MSRQTDHVKGHRGRRGSHGRSPTTFQSVQPDRTAKNIGPEDGHVQGEHRADQHQLRVNAPSSRAVKTMVASERQASEPAWRSTAPKTPNAGCQCCLSGPREELPGSSVRQGSDPAWDASPG